MDQSGIRKYFSAVGAAYAAFSAAALASQCVILLLLRAAGVDISSMGTTASLALSMISMYLFGFPVFLALIRRLPPGPVPKEGVKPMSFGWLAVCLLICIGVMEAGNMIGNGLMALTSLISGHKANNTVVTMVLEGDILPVILFSALLAPVFEELMFRRLLIDRIRIFGDRTAIVVSGVMFGLIHGNFYQFFYACGLGMVFAYVYLRTGRVRTTIGLHMAVNTLGGVVGTILLKGLSSGGGQMTAASLMAALGMVFYAFLLIAAAIAGLVLLICLWNQRILLRGPFEIPASRRFQTAFLNVGMMLFVLICVLEFWMNMR